jgi:hypothetical protein
MSSFNYFRSSAVSEIIKIVKSNRNITYDALIVKLQVNPPFIKQETAKEFVKTLILDKQIEVDKEGVVRLCRH